MESKISFGLHPIFCLSTKSKRKYTGENELRFESPISSQPLFLCESLPKSISNCWVLGEI